MSLHEYSRVYWSVMADWREKPSSLFKLLLILFFTLFASHSSLFELQYGKSATKASNEALGSLRNHDGDAEDNVD